MAANDKEKLAKAYAIFIEGIRAYIVTLLMENEGDKWPARFAECLTYDQKDFWNQGLKNGTSPEAMIDYHHLKSFSIKNKDLLKNDFQRKVGDVPNWFGEIASVRHDLNHYKPIIDEDEATKAWIHMRTIAKSTGMSELEDELKKIQNNTEQITSTPSISLQSKTSSPTTNGDLKPWFLISEPHFDIKQGHLDESVFAANLAEVALGTGREIYKDPNSFFSKTFMTAGLKSVAKTVVKGLNGKEDAENRVISLQTGFGGGKTHTLISIYHLCNWGKSAAASSYTKELLDYTGVPEFEKANIAVFTNTTNDPVQGRTVDGITIRTIWGEIAYQLGGVDAFNLIKANDEQLSAPKGLFKSVLEKCNPALILIDELADYCVSASAITVGSSSLADQTISFMQEFTEAVAATENCVAIITLPASVQEVANSPQAASILSSLQSRVSRVGVDTQPVSEDEIYEVIRRRLFENIGDKAYIESVATNYIKLYADHWTELPDNVTKSEYKQKLIQSYPFHPELIDIFKTKWASNNNFQRTRGVLRLLAALVSDLWKRQQSLTGSNVLIHSGDLHLPNLDSVTSQLKKLYGNGYESVISADIAGSGSNAFKIDSSKPEFEQYHLTQSIATVLLLNSFGTEAANKGLSTKELKLHLISPNSYNHNSINSSLDALEDNAFYLYAAQTGSSGKRFWFHVKPNISMLINQAKDDIKSDEINGEIIRRLKDKIRNVALFNVLVDPAADIPEQMKPTLIILNPKNACPTDSLKTETKSIIQAIATKKGSSERIYRNTILFLVPQDSSLGKLQSEVREYLACQKISSDYSSTLENDQKTDVKKRSDEASKNAESNLSVTYSTVVKYSSLNDCELLPIKEFKDSFDSQINSYVLETLKAEEWLIDAVGLGVLRKNNLLPNVEAPIKCKDVYESFLRFDDKPMITGLAAVNRSLARYCVNNEFAIATGDGKIFTSYFIGKDVPYFDVSDTSYWLVDKTTIPVEKPVETNNSILPTPAIQETGGSSAGATAPAVVDEVIRTINSITISGKVPMEQYTQLFQSFIMPLAQNSIEIEIKIKGKSTEAKPINENSQEYKIVKESAKQLGLNFHEE
jgi:predicted AAA+ superfamily ATPase